MALEGNLKDFSATDILQLLGTQKKTGCLLLEREGDHASFYVLEGRVRFLVGDQELTCGAGDFVHVPPGGIHGFKNESDQPASMLIHFAPGAPREAYFEGLAAWAKRGRPRDEAAAEFYRRHDNIWI